MGRVLMVTAVMVTTVNCHEHKENYIGDVYMQYWWQLTAFFDLFCQNSDLVSIKWIFKRISDLLLIDVIATDVAFKKDQDHYNHSFITIK